MPAFRSLADADLVLRRLAALAPGGAGLDPRTNNPKADPMTTSNNPTDGPLIANLAQAAVAPARLDTDDVGTAIAAVGAYPPGWELHVKHLELDRYADRPRRKQGTVIVRETESFLAYIDLQITLEEHGGTEPPPVIYYEPEQFTATAVFNGHTFEGPGWGDHRVHLVLEATPEWKAWQDIDRAYLSAVELAEFIEEWRHTIAAPATADLLDIIRSFRATQRASFRQEHVDASGDRALEYVVETTAEAGKAGSLPIPEALTLALAPFEGAANQPVTATFRYRLNDGRATFGVALQQAHLAARAAFQAEVDRIKDHAAFVVLNGNPASTGGR